MLKPKGTMLKLTETAIHRLHWIAERNNSKYCRLSVKGGGCAGFEYEWTTSNEQQRGDVLLNDILLVNRDYELYTFYPIYLSMPLCKGSLM